jgi:hypothetical protein
VPDEVSLSVLEAWELARQLAVPVSLCCMFVNNLPGITKFNGGKRT